ncbi:MAG: glycosyltransferase family 2 protein [Candidatus Nezhaarchaeales archaeon]
MIKPQKPDSEDHMNKVTVIIPTLNEGSSIGKVIDELLEEGFKRDRIIVVDGGSTDETIREAELRHVTVIQQEGKGKADAIKTALKYVKTPYALVIDGDYTYTAQDAKKLIQALKKHDEVIGARIKGKSHIPILNRFGNWVITKTFNVLFGTSLRDVCSGLYALRLKAIKDEEIETQDFSIEVELAAKIASKTGRITDIPITYRKRIGETKLRKKMGLAILKDTIKLAWRYNPVFLIFMVGAMLLIPGILLGGWVALKLFLYGVKHHVLGTIALILSAAGLQSLAISILALYLKRQEYRYHRVIDKMLTEITKIKRRIKSRK